MVRIWSTSSIKTGSMTNKGQVHEIFDNYNFSTKDGMLYDVGKHKITIPHNMEQSKHEQLAREIAEEMAAAKIGKAWPGAAQSYKENKIKELTPLARIAVMHMASEFRAGYRCGVSYCNAIKLTNITPAELTKTPLLIERGLIPDPNQPEETGKKLP